MFNLFKVGIHEKVHCRKIFGSSSSQVFNRTAALENLAKLAGSLQHD